MDSKKRIAIRNKAGEEIGVFYCPSDPEALKRYAESMERYKKSVMPLICINIAPDGTTTTKSGKRIIQNAENSIYKLFDFILGYDGASNAFFSAVRPFARVKGKFYCEHCLDVVKHSIDSQEVKSHGKKG